ncbi:DsrE family protein [Raineya orbicola]|jgi:intracellular sulfur oxidation DsrE/DsrF family protein|uniref:DsrE/DsrF-like family n=1 Tax=Raineya orbicola TaxID=2016530 RepID=A0A2N3IAF5_9BACT|nr:DsrE family protein [Raineya orbicola]PKQ67213.1 DsrE/DsrF-like family [Raineya orbicola]
MKRSFLLTLFLIFGLGATWAQNNKTKQHKVVIQLTTPDTAAYRALSKQLNNLISVWKDADVVVVVHNKGINMLKKNTSNVSEEIKQLSGRGVKFLACEFTMQQQKLTKEDMLEGIFYTPYGLIEIITRQENGYHYLKGGF